MPGFGHDALKGLVGLPLSREARERVAMNTGAAFAFHDSLSRKMHK